MADLYPTEEEITMFGEKLKYPGLKDGKFTNGSFTDPKQLASFIPAETLNLILDNLAEAIKSVGLNPNNTDTDQLKKAISKASNNTVLSERIENAINLYTENVEYVTPDENGIIYSQTIDLQQMLADKLGKNKNDIKIVDWNILKTRYKNQSVLSNSPNYNIENKELEDYVSIITDSVMLKDLFFSFAIQVADELTEDIKNLNITKLSGNMPDMSEVFKNKTDCIIASQKYKATILYNTPFAISDYESEYISAYLLSSASLYSIVYNSFVGQVRLTAKIDIAKKNYFCSDSSSDIYFVPMSTPTPILSIAVSNLSMFDSSSILFHGNKIKINIKSLGDKTTLCMNLDTKYDVAVRYSII